MNREVNSVSSATCFQPYSLIRAAWTVNDSMSEEIVRRKLGNLVLSEKDGDDAVKET